MGFLCYDRPMNDSDRSQTDKFHKAARALERDDERLKERVKHMPVEKPE